MWHTGYVFCGGVKYEYQAKVYEKPSPHGYGGGRVSKLWIPSIGVNWDRGDGCGDMGHPAVQAVLCRYP